MRKKILFSLYELSLDKEQRNYVICSGNLVRNGYDKYRNYDLKILPMEIHLLVGSNEAEKL